MRRVRRSVSTGRSGSNGDWYMVVMALCARLAAERGGRDSTSSLARFWGVAIIKVSVPYRISKNEEKNRYGNDK